jgi:hypothetical protein
VALVAREPETAQPNLLQPETKAARLPILGPSRC